MDKDELTIGLEADGCLGTANPDLIIFSIGKEDKWSKKCASKRANFPELRKTAFEIICEEDNLEFL